MNPGNRMDSCWLRSHDTTPLTTATTQRRLSAQAPARITTKCPASRGRASRHPSLLRFQRFGKCPAMLLRVGSKPQQDQSVSLGSRTACSREVLFQ